MDIEFCIDSLEGALAAQKYKVKRVELCSSLDVGGLTPDNDLIKKCSLLKNVETHVMIRPKAGDFNYNPKEILIMQKDIMNAKKAGAHGVVFGCLDTNYSIDIDKNKALIDNAKNLDMQATFHRAFDNCIDPIKGLETLIELGFNRILTSGKEATAIEGIQLIKALVSKSSNQIEIMAGSGVNALNSNLLAKTGIHALHFTIHKKSDRNITTTEKTSVIDIDKVTSIIEVLG